MARVNLLDTRTTSFGELIGNGKIYQVPLFQRDYAWKEENWEDLWQDILALYSGESASHYMGAIVLQSTGVVEKTFTIIDGQQRLATLSILAIAVISKVQQLVKQGIEPEANTDRQEILKRTYLGDRDPGSLKYSSKLLLNENNNDFYQSNLINLREPRNLRALSKSNRLLWQAFSYFSIQLEDLTEVISIGENLAEFLTETVARRLLFIEINVQDELNAYTVFETLNARGTELSSTDLLKNYLFSLCKGDDDLREAQRQWRRIISTVQMDKFPEFLRYYLSLTHVRVRRERLFKTVRESVKNNQQTFGLLEKLEDYSSLFVALDNANDEFWRDYPTENRRYVRELNIFRVRQVYPALFAAYQAFSAEDFTRVLKLASIISFRHSVISGLNPNDLEKAYNEVAVGIASGKITTPRQVFEHLRDVYVSDSKFQQDFEFFAVPANSRKKQIVKYILNTLEEDATGRLNDSDSFSIEHILPESPSEVWYEAFSEAQIEDLVYRLGNLTPLESTLNRKIGNATYEVKQTYYQQSVYTLTQNITNEEWTPEAITNRQRRLAKRAVHI